MTDIRTDRATGEPSPGDPTSDERLRRFDEAVTAMGHRPSAGDRRWVVAGLVAMAAGIVLTIVAYVTSTSQSDTRDVISSGILASIGVAVVIGGAAVFLRGSLIEFLRFWLLRVLLARDDDAGR